MADYTALVAKWQTLNPGTTQAKLDALNALTVTGGIPATFTVTGDQLFNCLDFTEFNALTAQQQSNLLAICKIPGNLKGGTGSFFAGLVPIYYAGKLGGPTVLAMTALAKAQVQPWWQASIANGGGGLTSPVNANDLAAAGGLT